jgi:hypothetical protein
MCRGQRQARQPPHLAPFRAGVSGQTTYPRVGRAWASTPPRILSRCPDPTSSVGSTAAGGRHPRGRGDWRESKRVARRCQRISFPSSRRGADPSRPDRWLHSRQGLPVVWRTPPATSRTVGVAPRLRTGLPRRPGRIEARLHRRGRRPAGLGVQWAMLSRPIVPRGPVPGPGGAPSAPSGGGAGVSGPLWGQCIRAVRSVSIDFPGRDFLPAFGVRGGRARQSLQCASVRPITCRSPQPGATRRVCRPAPGAWRAPAATSADPGPAGRRAICYYAETSLHSAD